MENLGNLDAMFSGASILGNTVEVTKTTMKNGIAKLHSVSEFTSKKGNLCAKLVFRTLAKPEDETSGHIEYVSLSDGARFARTISKIAYLAAHSSNTAGIEAFKTLPNPVTIIKDESGQPIIFNDLSDLDGIREVYGEETTFLWIPNDEDKRMVAVQFNNVEAYIKSLIAALNNFVGGKYFLEVETDRKGFQQLKNIGKAVVTV